MPLPPGCVLCLYSDGLVERRDVDIDDNIEKLRNTVTAQPAESVCVEVMRRLIGATTPRDDVALLVARRVEPDRATTTAAAISATAEAGSC